MEQPIRWGLLGTGKIATKFAAGLGLLPDAVLAAVGSRSQASADAFGAAVGAHRAHGSYEALVADPEVDVVYVGTPHSVHRAHTLLALQHGKAVLCEKPFTLNAREAAEVVAFARRQGLFLMEAMWTRFIPLMDVVRDLLAGDALGDVRMLTADFGFQADFGPAHRLYDPALGGGALLDVGVYPVSLASMLWGAPRRVTGAGHLGASGVDERGAYVLDYGDRLAVFYTALDVDTPVEAVMMGTKGRLRLHRRFHHADRLTLTRADGAEEVITRPVEGNGLHYQAAEVMRCLRAGRTESPLMPLDESCAILETLDALRAGIGLRYPGE